MCALLSLPPGQGTGIDTYTLQAAEVQPLQPLQPLLLIPTTTKRPLRQRNHAPHCILARTSRHQLVHCPRLTQPPTNISGFNRTLSPPARPFAVAPSQTPRPVCPFVLACPAASQRRTRFRRSPAISRHKSLGSAPPCHIPIFPDVDARHCVPSIITRRSRSPKSNSTVGGSALA